jgi:hypothetical protein
MTATNQRRAQWLFLLRAAGVEHSEISPALAFIFGYWAAGLRVYLNLRVDEQAKDRRLN